MLFFVMIFNFLNVPLLIMMLSISLPPNFYAWGRFFGSFLVPHILPQDYFPEAVRYTIFNQYYYGSDSAQADYNQGLQRCGFALSFLINCAEQFAILFLLTILAFGFLVTHTLSPAEKIPSPPS